MISTNLLVALRSVLSLSDSKGQNVCMGFYEILVVRYPYGVARGRVFVGRSPCASPGPGKDGFSNFVDDFVLL
jgi:hypothetical protein